MKVFEFENKNWKLTIPKLHAKINPEKSNVQIKQNYIIVNLAKEGLGVWSELHFSKKFDPLKKFDKDEDPNQGLFKMMQRMYEEGDDNMKKTIGEAWTKAKEQKS